MAFPDDVLDISVRFAPAGTMIDITDYVYLDNIVIDRGSADETTTSQPTKCTFRLNNIDGRFSPRNPSGPYFEQIGRNTPIEVCVNEGARYLNVPGSGRAQTVDSAQVSVTGDIDVRVDATLMDWSGEDAVFNGMELIGKAGGAGQVSWLFGVSGGRLWWRWSSDGTASTNPLSTDALVPDASGRLAVRVTHDVDNGASGNTVTFYTGPTIDGPWTQLGDPVVSAGTTSLFDSNAALCVGDGVPVLGFQTPTGKFWAAKVFNGISGTVAADIDFRIQDVGDTSFTGADGLTWTTSGSGTISNEYIRFRGEAVAWPARWTTGGFDSWVPMVAESLVRRLNQGQKSLKSALARRIPSDPDLVAYWPMEDGSESTRFASALPGGQAMVFTGDVDPQGHVGPSGSDDLPSFNTNCSWFASVPASGTQTGWHAEWVLNLQQVTGTERTIQQFQATGTILNWRILVSSSGLRVQGRTRDGTLTVDQGLLFTISAYLNIWVRWRLEAEQDGANVDWSIVAVPISGDAQAFDGTYAGTVGRITAVSGPPNLNTDVGGLAWGHMAVLKVKDSAIFDEADHGFTGENAWDRMHRLAEEENIPINIVGNGAGTPAMGAQRPDKLIDLLQEAADADRGILGDSRDAAGETSFKFISRSALYNQPVRLQLGYEDDGEVHAPLDPTDDDQYTRNLVIAERERGSAATVEVTDGPLGTEAIGTYDTTVTVNVASDDRLVDYAGWEAHLGTWDEERYPTVLIRLQAAPHLISDAVGVDQGSRIRLVDARDEADRTWIAPGDIDLMVRGYTETISQFTWEIELQCVPARPYDVAEFSRTGQQVDRLDTDGSELSEALDSTETEVEVLTTSGPTWTDDVGDMPFDWLVGGEAVRVAAPGSLINANPFFTTDTTGWTASNSSIARSTAVVHPDPLAVASLLVTPNGSSALVGASVTRTAVGSINPGARFVASMWVWANVAHTDFHMRVDWLTAASGAISTSTGTAVSIPAGVWTQVKQEFTAPATASRADLFIQQGGTPASTKTWYCWAPRINRAKASLIYDEFGRTDTDTWTNADSSQTWTNAGTAADYDVLSGYGRHINPAASVAHESTIANTEPDSDLYADVAVAALATGASLFAGPVARFADTNNLYQARLEFTTGNVINLTIRKRVASVETQLGTFTHWIAAVAGTFMRVRFQVIGSALKAKAWRVGDPEPDVWQVSVTDSALTAAGSVGCRSVRNAGNTNANADFRFDNFELANPQVYSVVRSANGVVKSHSSGAAVALRFPMILAL
jgi:hypothetical protein